MTPYDGYFTQASARYGVPRPILEAIAWTESSMGKFDPPGDGIGIMQVLPSTGRALGFSEIDLRDAQKNIMAGAAALADIIKRQGGINLADMYSEYNSGRRDLWRTSSQVRDHVRNFLSNLANNVLGVKLPAGWTIEEAIGALSTVPTENWSGLLVVLALMLFKKR